MSSSIPNDVYQFSTISAIHAGFNTGQPCTSDLTTHGTHGIGIYEDGTLLLLKDSRAFSITKTGLAKSAQPDARLPWAMVTVYEPSFKVTVFSLTIDTFDALVSGDDLGPVKGVNTLMPFLIAGHFSSLEFRDGPRRNAIDGTLFGFVVPMWMKGICGPRIHAYFLDAGEEVGGRVEDFRMEGGGVLGFAKCGRFHLGFPQGEEWEALKM
ncbi:hypothetical protein IAQ61_011084 [Plenodomus lingam]|uniref:Alpha-acetolactate decarboxylase n=1 Tax=Leptosphaeria maculans (strain JN3 / isolate v23.1.3 / race Av1-4-5-6-7-8) TaxID=985895 RepID=E5AC32_LEPMJ|nr:hypothetical protein LEMA_P012730.1 [Plenodomus lingam JN3]KAH9859303.1 hypothetical protein IAQ61_011084 [Plenodomus lingam]CBY00143.1 hypothetical protein LEMA_P012730.1 [Plenodomus lingam JN3]